MPESEDLERLPHENKIRSHTRDSDSHDKETRKSQSEDKTKPSDSPHVLQNRDATYSSGFTRILTDDYEQLPYARRKGQDKTTAHFGQRKLLLAEIEFLTISLGEILSEPLFAEKKFVVIYAGAAPGYHMPLLINMFPFFEYYLVDPADFKLAETTGKVTLKNAFFDDEMATKLREVYKDYEILFVSDIRTANYRILVRLDIELKVEKDLEDQMGWLRILRPFKSLLKFRLPYVGAEKVSYEQRGLLDRIYRF